MVHGSFLWDGPQLCVLTLISALLRWHEPAVYLPVGGALYLIGALLVTIAFNVLRNELLASVAPADPDGASLWPATSPAGRPGTTSDGLPRVHGVAAQV